MRRGLVLACLLGCAGTADDTVTLAFAPDPGAPGSERYLCFGFDAGLLGGADIAGIALVPATGPVTLHHVALFASTDDFADGPIDCLTMPDTAVPLNVWATGGGDLVLPRDLALAVPPATRRLIVQTHALRIADGPPATRALTLSPRRDAMVRAGWLPLRAPTPAIAPHTRARSSASCLVAAELHVISSWPHMHRIGSEFHGTIARVAATDPLVDVVPYDFETQHSYSIDAIAAPGDTIDTECVWENTTDTTVLPGPEIDQEMCGQSLIAWPVEAAHCS